MGLREDREPVVLETFDQEQLPQRLGAVEPLRVDARDEPAQSGLVARDRQRLVEHVVFEVEARIVDPAPAPEAERGLRELLAVARDAVQADTHVLEKLVPVRRRPLEDRDAADVHLGVRALLKEERRVERAQRVQMLLWLGHTGRRGY